MDLVEFADIKALLSLDGDCFADYPALETIADSVSAAIEVYLGRALELMERTEQFSVPDPTRLIPLDGLPVASVSSVTLTTNEGSSSTTTEYAIANFGIQLLSLFSGGVVTVVYTGGLSTVPEWLKRAALMQTAYEFQNKDHIGADYVSIEGGSVGRPALSLLSEVQRMLNPYRHPGIVFWQ